MSQNSEKESDSGRDLAKVRDHGDLNDGFLSKGENVRNLLN